MIQPLSDPMIQEVSNLFGALGDSSRLKILRALLEAERPINQGTVAEATGLSQANASKHLACLVRVGLVLREAEGNMVFFHPLLPLVADLCSLVSSHVSQQVRASYRALN